MSQSIQCTQMHPATSGPMSNFTLHQGAFISFLVMLTSPFRSQPQALGSLLRVTRNELDLEIPRNRHQCRLDLIVVHIVSVWWCIITCYNLVGRQEPQKSCIQKPGCDELAGTSTRTGPEAEMRKTGDVVLLGWIDALQPSFRVESASVRSEMVYIYSRSALCTQTGCYLIIPWFPACALIKTIVLGGITAPFQLTSVTVFLGRLMELTV